MRINFLGGFLWPSRVKKTYNIRKVWEDCTEIGAVLQVWSEPEVVEAAAFEFQDTNSFLEAGVILGLA